MAILDTLFGGSSQAELLGGLLGEDKMNQLRSQAAQTGLINAAIGYFAQPKNQRFGSALPYLARALTAGQQGAQGVYEDALRNYQFQQKMEEVNREKAARAEFEKARGNLFTTTPAKYQEVTLPGGYAPQQAEVQAEQVAPNYGLTKLPDVTQRVMTAPEQQVMNEQALQQMLLSGDPRATSYLTGLKTIKEISTPAKQFNILNEEQAKAYGLPTDRGQRYQLTSSGVQLIGGTEQKESKGPSYTDAYKNLAITMFGTDNPADLTVEQRRQLDATVRQRSLEKPPQTVVMTPRQVFQDEQSLRKEYTAIPEVKLFGEVQNAFDTIKTSLTKASPAGDLAGATKFMKLLDPGSVVRESELGMAMAATGALDRALNYFQMLKSGQKLSPTQRQDFLDLSSQLYEAAKERKTAFDNQYADIASQNQLNPSNVVRGWKPSGGWSIKEKK